MSEGKQQPATLRGCKEFVELVQEMRTAQRGFYELKSDSAKKRSLLQVCKSIEAQVDQWLKLYNEEAAKWSAWEQASLAPDGEASSAIGGNAQPKETTHTHTSSSIEGARND